MSGETGDAEEEPYDQIGSHRTVSAEPDRTEEGRHAQRAEDDADRAADEPDDEPEDSR